MEKNFELRFKENGGRIRENDSSKRRVLLEQSKNVVGDDSRLDNLAIKGPVALVLARLYHIPQCKPLLREQFLLSVVWCLITSEA